MPQTVYNLDPAPAIAGQVVHRDGPGGARGRYECSEDMLPGRFSQLHSDGKLRQPQSTTLTKVMGVTPYNASMTVGGYKAGVAMVPAVRRGQIWVEYAGTPPAVETAPNIMHSSQTVATHRGKVTGDAINAGAGVEISAAPAGVVVIKVDTVNLLALVELNLP